MYITRCHLLLLCVYINYCSWSAKQSSPSLPPSLPPHTHIHFFLSTLQIKFCSELDTFVLDDGYQPPVTLMSPSREILGATFYKYVLKNIGTCTCTCTVNIYMYYTCTCTCTCLVYNIMLMLRLSSVFVVHQYNVVYCSSIFFRTPRIT